MADKKTKVEFIQNEDTTSSVDFSELSTVEIRGATGVATYRLDPLQDVVIRVVVTGTPVTDDPEEAPLPAESFLGYFGTAENVKAFQDRQKEAEKAAQEAAKAESAPSTTSTTVKK